MLPVNRWKREIIVDRMSAEAFHNGKNAARVLPDVPIDIMDFALTNEAAEKFRVDRAWTAEELEVCVGKVVFRDGPHVEVLLVSDGPDRLAELLGLPVAECLCLEGVDQSGPFPRHLNDTYHGPEVRPLRGVNLFVFRVLAFLSNPVLTIATAESVDAKLQIVLEEPPSGRFDLAVVNVATALFRPVFAALLLVCTILDELKVLGVGDKSARDLEVWHVEDLTTELVVPAVVVLLQMVLTHLDDAARDVDKFVAELLKAHLRSAT